MIEKIKIFKGNEELKFEITNFNLNVEKTTYKNPITLDREIIFLSKIEIEGKALSFDIFYNFQKFKKPAKNLSIKIYEKHKKGMETIIILDNYYITEIYCINYDNEILNLKLIKKMEW